MNIQPKLPEEDIQKVLLNTPVGQPGSGAARYGAAMYFYKREMLSARMLEVYRMCSKFDRDDPIKVAAYEGIEHPDLTATEAAP